MSGLPTDHTLIDGPGRRMTFFDMHSGFENPRTSDLKPAFLPEGECDNPYETYSQISPSGWITTEPKYRPSISPSTYHFPGSKETPGLITLSDPTLPQLWTQGGLYPNWLFPKPASTSVDAFNGSLESISMRSSPPVLSSHGSPPSEWQYIKAQDDPLAPRHYSLPEGGHGNLGLQDANTTFWAKLSSTTPDVIERSLQVPQTWTNLTVTGQSTTKERFAAEREHRRSKDEFLKRARCAGMSYRQIRKEGRFLEAESTLRGRYRVLTKEKRHRLRKPTWTDGDIHLLNTAVDELHAKRKSTTPTEQAPRTRASKVPWKKVGEYIKANGGSYHFGSATCKKKWLETQGVHNQA